MKGRKNHKATDAETEQEKTICYILRQLRKTPGIEARSMYFDDLTQGRKDKEFIKNEVLKRWKNDY